MTGKGLFQGKGQSSVEFLMVVGIALAISAPFVLSAQRSIINIQQTQESVAVQKSLDRMGEAISTVSVSGEPARRTFMVNIPDSVVEAQVKDRAIVYTLRTPSGLKNISKNFETRISAVDRGLPVEGGRITVYAWNNQVNISAVEIQTDSTDKNKKPGRKLSESVGITTRIKISIEKEGAKALFYVNNGELAYLDPDEGKTNTIYSAKEVEVLGPQNPDIDGDSRYEVPFVTSGGTLRSIDIYGETQKLADGAKSKKSKLGLSLSGSDTGILYPGNSNNNYEIYSVSLNSDPKEVANPGDGVSAVAGKVDFDGDGKKEIVFVGGSQTLQYVDHNGNVKSTGVGVGSNNGLGLGHPYDFNNDGVPRTPIVDGSNNIILVDFKADKTQITTSGPSRKTSIAVIDMDGDSKKEIAYISKDTSSIKYIDDVTGKNSIKSPQATVKPDPSVGITARLN